MLSFKRNKYSRVVPPAQKSNRRHSEFIAYYGNRLLDSVCFFLCLRSHACERVEHLEVTGLYPMEAISLPVLLSLSLVLHLVLAELHCDLHVCMVQILQRLSPTSPLLSVLLWSPPLAFPFGRYRTSKQGFLCTGQLPTIYPLTLFRYFIRNTVATEMFSDPSVQTCKGPGSFSSPIPLFFLLQPSRLKHNVL